MSQPDPKDVRFRPYRGAAWALYLFVAVGYSLLVVYSVVSGVIAITPKKPAAGATQSAEECLQIAQTMFQELEAKRKSLVEVETTEQRQASWMKFRLDWLTRKREAESHCSATGQERVLRTFAALEELSDGYAVHATQFSEQLAPLVDEFQRAMK